MNILIVGNVIKDVYLNLDSRTDNFETDKNNIKWLNLSFDASEHHFFSRNSSFGGAAVSLEVFKKLGLDATVSNSDIRLTDDGLTVNSPVKTHRYILISDENVSYLTPTNHEITTYDIATESYNYLYVDRSAELDATAVKKINAYLDISKNTKLVLYVRTNTNPHLNSLVPRAELIILEEFPQISAKTQAPELDNADPKKIIHIAENYLSYLNITEHLSVNRIDIMTHLSAYSIAAATIFGCFVLGYTVENSLKLARANMENSKLDSTLPLSELQTIADEMSPSDNIELIAANLVFGGKGILAADESGGSIQKKFSQLNIPDTYENRRDYRNIFFTTPNLEQYVNGVILFDETTKQLADNGQNFTDFLTSKRIIPGIKVDQGLEKIDNSLETYTKGLEGLDERLKEYYSQGLRFAKWRAAFEIYLSDSGKILTPTEHAIEKNCQILAEYAKKCQNANIVPIVEPEVVYNGYYSIEDSSKITARILDVLFENLKAQDVKLSACILKVNMILAGKNYHAKSTPKEIGVATAKVLKEHVPTDLAGVIFLSGGQTPEQATDNLTEIIKNGPFPWPVTFSFARALQDPALFAWEGNNDNADKARQAFLTRLIANCKALNKKEQE